MSRAGTPRGASASSTALTTAAGAPIEPASPQPLAPSGLWVQGWLSSPSVTYGGRSAADGTGDSTRRAPHELAAAVVGAMLEQRLADALGEAAVDLALDDHRIDDGADVIDAPETDDLDAAGVRIDLELTDMRAVAEGEARRIVDRGLLQAGLDGLERKVVRYVSRSRHRRERHAPVGAGNDEGAIGEIDVARGRLEQVGRDQLALGDDLVGGAIERAAADRDRARAERAGAVRD